MVTFKSIREYLSVIFVVGAIVSVIVYRGYKNYMDNKVIKSGVRSIAYIYEVKSGGKAGASALYYYYCNNMKYYGSQSGKYAYSFEEKFCIVYYDKDSKYSFLDFDQVVPNELVHMHFPEGRNPFINEIEQAKGFNFKEFLSPEIKK